MASEQVVNNGAGKGDKPRSCFSKRFKTNYDEIDWTLKPKKVTNKDETRK